MPPSHDPLSCPDKIVTLLLPLPLPPLSSFYPYHHPDVTIIVTLITFTLTLVTPTHTPPPSPPPLPPPPHHPPPTPTPSLFTPPPRGPLCDALAEAAELEEKNGHLSQYVAGQETIARVLREQGERYRRLIHIQETVAAHFLGLTKGEWLGLPALLILVVVTTYPCLSCPFSFPSPPIPALFISVFPPPIPVTFITYPSSFPSFT